MITTEITVRQGVKTTTADGLETGWSDVVVRTAEVTSNEVTLDHIIECKLKTKELVNLVQVDAHSLESKAHDIEDMVFNISPKHSVMDFMPDPKRSETDG